MVFDCNLGLSPFSFWYSALILGHQSGAKRGGWSSLLSSWLMAIICSLSNIWSSSRHSTILCLYSLCALWSLGGALLIKKCGSRNSFPSTNVLAISPVLACGIPWRAFNRRGSTRSQCPCPGFNKRELSASPSTLLILSTTSLRWR